MIETLIVAVVMGAIVGAVARALVHNRVKGGCGTNIAIGIVGSVLGSMLFRFLGGAGVSGFNLYSFFVALVGAVVLLVLHRALSK